MAARIGGSFAPPLTTGKVTAFRKLAERAPPAVGEAMGKLCDMVDLFHEMPASTQPGTPHPVGMGNIVHLEEAEKARIEHLVPWAHENRMYADLFEGIDPKTDKPLRDAAFHLLWYAVELTNDREPLTSDRL
jgi:hypothetical protein